MIIDDFIEKTIKKEKIFKCLALIGDKNISNKILYKIIKSIGINNCHFYQRKLHIDEYPDENGSNIHIDTKDNLSYNKKLLIFNEDDLINYNCGFIKSITGDDNQIYYIKNENYEGNEEYYDKYEVKITKYYCNFIILLTKKIYENLDLAMKRRFNILEV